MILIPMIHNVTDLDFLIQVVLYEKVLWWWDKPISRLWWIYMFSVPLNMKTLVFGNVPACLCVCVCVCVCVWAPMCSSQAFEWLERLSSYWVFHSLSITGQCPVRMNILVQKQRPLRWLHFPPPSKKTQFSWKWLQRFWLHFNNLQRPLPCPALNALMWNVHFLENNLTDND
jgi:hypothetical protein